MRIRPGASLFLVALSCGNHETISASVSTAVNQPKVSANAPLSIPPSKPFNLSDAICHGRSPCRVPRTVPAGSANGEDLQIAVAELFPLDANAKKESDSPDWQQTSSNQMCKAYEYWLVRGRGERPTITQLSAACNDGYGVAGVGMDDIRIGPNVFAHSKGGGSAWRWSEAFELQLAPLMRISEESSSYHAIGGTSQEEHWNWRTFSGGGAYRIPKCNPQGEPEELPEQDGDTYVTIPRATLPLTYSGKDWKTTSLDSCSVMASGDLFRISGKKTTTRDASFRLVVSEINQLFVEITDDKFVMRPNPGRSWLAQDHLEIWASDVELDRFGFCVAPTDDQSHLQQWAILLSDSRVIPAFGKPNAMEASRADEVRADGTQIVRMRIVLPSTVKTLTVVYSDSDDGGTQKSLIGTSQFTFGRASTLGRMKTISAGDGTCNVEHDKLVSRVTAPYRFVPEEN